MCLEPEEVLYWHFVEYSSYLDLVPIHLLISWRPGRDNILEYSSAPRNNLGHRICSARAVAVGAICWPVTGERYLRLTYRAKYRYISLDAYAALKPRLLSLPALRTERASSPTWRETIRPSHASQPHACTTSESFTHHIHRNLRPLRTRQMLSGCPFKEERYARRVIWHVRYAVLRYDDSCPLQ